MSYHTHFITREGNAIINYHFAKKNTIHQVTTMLAISKNILFPGQNHWLTTSGFELMTSRSWQYIPCHWDACSNRSASSDFCILWIAYDIQWLSSNTSIMHTTLGEYIYVQARTQICKRYALYTLWIRYPMIIEYHFNNAYCSNTAVICRQLLLVLY